jgi:uncharacterized membrane protein
MDNNNSTFLKKNFAKIIFTAAAFIIAVLLVTVGFYKTVFVVAVSVAAYYLGRLLDDRDALRKFIDSYLGRS